jgi:exopolysaccharide biosynthesis predicted pyruvyltransferase EpsI
MHSRLADKIDSIIVPLVNGKTDHICIIDPPGHSNVGDSAILLGELNFIAKNFPNAQLSYYDLATHSSAADRFIEEATIIMIHGGGNFGDIWPDHHALRMKIFERFAHKTIVQFPQSIHFDDEAKLRATAAVIKKQQDYTLLVRDLISFEIAKNNFECKVLLSPDMAFAMKPLRRGPAKVDYLCLFRTDKEALIDQKSVCAALQQGEASVEVYDWLGQSRNLTIRLEEKLKRLTRVRPAVTAPLRSAMMRLRRHYATQRLNYGVNLLSKGSTVVTDRLHAHILCCLLDIPHFVFDSYDGKISAFHATWTKEYSDGHLVSSLKELPALLAKMRDSRKNVRQKGLAGAHHLG